LETWLYSQLRKSSPRSFTFLQDRTTPHSCLNVSAVLMSGCVNVAEDVWNQSLRQQSLNLPPLDFFFWGFVKDVYPVVFWIMTQCRLCSLDSKGLGFTGSV
jgi:hypothetical protein